MKGKISFVFSGLDWIREEDLWVTFFPYFSGLDLGSEERKKAIFFGVVV